MARGRGRPPRERIVIEARDEARIFEALEQWARTEDFVALRTRAFAYLLWDGALRPTAARLLNVEDVLASPGSGRLRVANKAVLRASGDDEERVFLLSDRAREGLSDYLRVVRDDEWLPKGLRGPLFLSSYFYGTGKRVSNRTLTHCWNLALKQAGIPRKYTMEDIVYTGRVRFLEAAQGDAELLSDHAGISSMWAAQYAKELDAHAKQSSRDVLARATKARRR